MFFCGAGSIDIVLMHGHAQASEVVVGAKLALIGLTMSRAGYTAYSGNRMVVPM